MNGLWGSWGSYGSCSRPCNGGVQERFRSCNKPAPAHGGSGCTGSSKTVRSCNTHKCPGQFMHSPLLLFFCDGLNYNFVVRKLCLSIF